jgi:uncharacterized protein YbbK (DUF523 family)
MTERVRILVSACLLGEKVRYDGGHKRDLLLMETLGPFVEWVRVCPEVDGGLPVPREAMRLEGDPKRPRLVTNRTGIDHTERMERWAKTRLEELSGLDLRGYICKKDSPSCGMEPAGVFTRMFIERFPRLPVEEEGRLADPMRCEEFIRRIMA